MKIKCIVKGCENHKDEGGFEDGMCLPCYLFITTGDGIYSQAYRNTHLVKDREKDRLRFSDEAFNHWLDESISDSGHTVYDQIPDVCCAWHGWFNREFYAPLEIDTLQSLRGVIIQQQAEIAHLKELFGCDPAYFEVSKK